MESQEKGSKIILPRQAENELGYIDVDKIAQYFIQVFFIVRQFN